MAQGAIDKVHQKPKDKTWSIPPYDEATALTLPAGSATSVAVPAPTGADPSILLTQAIIYEVRISADCFLQNTSENEDDFIEWSKHGDPYGLWMRLDVSNLLEVGAGLTLFLYNRTHKQNSVISVFVK